MLPPCLTKYKKGGQAMQFEDDYDEEDNFEKDFERMFDEDYINNMPDEELFELLEGLAFEPMIEEKGVFLVTLEVDRQILELSIRVTPNSVDGGRHVDVLEAYDIINHVIISMPREIVPQKQIDDAVDSLIWVIENSDELSAKDRDKYLSWLH
jgi:hypothetical protein